MKTNKYVPKIIFIILTLLFCSSSYATIITVFAVTGYPAWVPMIVSADIGDTIRFTGGCTEQCHNSVCDGRPGTQIPDGATPWVSPTLMDSGYYYVLRVPGTYRYMCTHHSNSALINVSFPTVISSINENANSFRLDQNYPNPFNPVTEIKFDIPSNVKGQTLDVILKVYDVMGKEVQALVNDPLSPGSYEVEFNGANLSSGIYFYKLTSGDFVSTKKMLLIK